MKGKFLAMICFSMLRAACSTLSSTGSFPVTSLSFSVSLGCSSPWPRSVYPVPQDTSVECLASLLPLVLAPVAISVGQVSPHPPQQVRMLR